MFFPPLKHVVSKVRAMRGIKVRISFIQSNIEKRMRIYAEAVWVIKKRIAILTAKHINYISGFDVHNLTRSNS